MADHDDGRRWWAEISTARPCRSVAGASAFRSTSTSFIFVYEPLAHLLLDHAIAAGEPNGVVEHAAYLLHQPSDSAPHDDHFHVRIYCAPSDRPLGCSDRAVLRWKKKAYKYELITAAVTLVARSPAPAVAVAPSRLLRASENRGSP